MNLRKVFATNLQALRKVKGYTQATLAADVGCSHSTIRDYENLKSFPGPENLEAIANCLKVTAADLITENKKELSQTDTTSDLLKFAGLIGQVKDFDELLSAVKKVVDHQDKSFDDLMDEATKDEEDKTNPNKIFKL